MNSDFYAMYDRKTDFLQHERLRRQEIAEQKRRTILEIIEENQQEIEIAKTMAPQKKAFLVNGRICGARRRQNCLFMGAF